MWVNKTLAKDYIKTRSRLVQKIVMWSRCIMHGCKHTCSRGQPSLSCGVCVHLIHLNWKYSQPAGSYVYSWLHYLPTDQFVSQSNSIWTGPLSVHCDLAVKYSHPAHRLSWIRKLHHNKEYAETIYYIQAFSSEGMY